MSSSGHRAALTAALAVAAALAVVPGASAATTGSATLTLRGPAAAALRAAGATTTAVAPAKRRAAALTLPVRSGKLTAAAALDHGGAIRFRVRRAGRTRTATLTAIHSDLRAALRLRGRLGARTMTVATGRPARGALTLVSRTGAVRLTATPLRLSHVAAAALRRALALPRAPTGVFGTLAVRATLPGASTAAPGAPNTPSPTGPSTTPITTQPVPLDRPATAVPITSASITWHVRDSFVQYLASGTASTDGARAIAPGTGDAPGNGCSSDGSVNDASLVYQFHFPFASGWYDPPSGHASVGFGGAVHFGYQAHGIDLTAGEPTIDLNGSASRATFRFTGSGNTNPANKRDTLVDLDPSAPAAARACGADPGPLGTTGTSGTTHTYERLTGTIPQGAATSVFAGFYQPGDKFGWFTVSFTTG